MRSHGIVSRNDVAAVQNFEDPRQTHVPELVVVPCRSPRSKGVRHHPLSHMAFLIILLRIFCRIVRMRDRSNRNITVLQNYFPVNLHDWMTDNQIDKADCSNRAAERDSVSHAKMKGAERTFIFQFDPTDKTRVYWG